jgi:phage tail-like protein
VNAGMLPPVARPPHDPMSFLVDARVGWSLVQTDDISTTHDALRLRHSRASTRVLTEPNGSFGGLRPPANVAFGDDAIWLLDPETLRLERFDPCSCRFEDVACFGGTGSGARELNHPHGIALTRDRLLVCDTGNGRISVFALPTFALAAHWTAPMPWEPTGIVVAGSGAVLVGDPQNGMIHRFSRHGTYLGHWDGFGAITDLVIDRAGEVYAAGALLAYQVGPAGTPIALTATADDLVDRFDPLPVAVDGAGRLHLGPLCDPPTALVFDEHGAALTLPPDSSAIYETDGAAILGPFDSRMERCVWHRIVVHGEVPNGTAFAVSTFASERAEDLLPDPPWEPEIECTAVEHGAWDALIRSRPGRFLWLRIALRGNGTFTPRVGALEIEFPRVSLRRHMPAVYGAEPESADFTDRLLAIFDRHLRDVEHTIDYLAGDFDPLSTPFLDWLASWIGVTLDRQVPEATRRALLASAGATASLRGTRYGLWRQLVAFLGMDGLTTRCQCAAAPCTCRPPVATCPPTPPYRWNWAPPPLILEHYQLRRWLEVGFGRLSDQAVLWGKRIVNRSQLGEGAQVGVTTLKGSQDPARDPFHYYAHRFTVFVPASAGATPQRRRSLARLLAREQPAHTEAHIEYVHARFRIGFQSMIGLDTVVARAPSGITLGETTLDAAVLSGDDHARIGNQRVGTTAAIS